MIKIQEEIQKEISRIGDYTIKQGRNGEYYIYYKDKFIVSLDENEYGKIDDVIDKDIKRREQESNDDKHKYAWYLAYTNKEYDGKAEFLNFDGTVTKKHYLNADYMTEKEKNTISKIYYNNHPKDKRIFLNYIE